MFRILKKSYVCAVFRSSTCTILLKQHTGISAKSRCIFRIGRPHLPIVFFISLYYLFDKQSYSLTTRDTKYNVLEISTHNN